MKEPGFPGSSSLFYYLKASQTNRGQDDSALAQTLIRINTAIKHGVIAHTDFVGLIEDVEQREAVASTSLVQALKLIT